MALMPNVTTYQEFRGVDFSASPAVISEIHAQDMKNMYVGSDGVMQKRPGWHICMTFQVSPTNPTRLPIYGIHYMRFAQGSGMLFIHADDRLYRVLCSPEIRHVDAASGDVPYYRAADDKPTAALAAWIARYVGGIDDGWEDWQIRNMDVNGDGQVTQEDADIVTGLVTGAIDPDTLDRGITPDSYKLVLDSEGSPVVLNKGKSIAFEHDGKLYIIDGKKYFVVKQTGNYLTGVDYVCDEVEGKIPTVNINAHYDYDELNSQGTNTPGSQSNPGVWNEGDKYDSPNMIQPKQICTFIADKNHTAYYLPGKNCTVHKVEVKRKAKYKRNEDGSYSPYPDVSLDPPRAYMLYRWEEIPDHDGEESRSDNPAQMFYKVVNGEGGSSWFIPAPIKNVGNKTAVFVCVNGTDNPTTDQEMMTTFDMKEGEANIRVTYTVNDAEEFDEDDKDKTVRGASTIAKCTIVTKFGYYNRNRFFLSGNPDHKNEDYMSEIDDPTYFPKNGWTKIGSENTAIMGYLHYGSELAIVKEDNGIDATVYMRSAILTEENDILFPVQQGAQGVGAISKYCLKTLKDEPLFLSKEGVYAIQGTNASQERTIPNRSFYIDKRLRREIDSQCVAEVFRDYYILVNPTTGHAWVCDSRYQSLPPGTNDRNHINEWYVWDNIPATCMTATDDFLFFGTKDGRLCAFNFDWDSSKRWTDGAEYVNGSTKLHKWHPYDFGYQIEAYYITKRDHLSAMDYKKTMLNDGGVITLQPHDQSSASIVVSTDKGSWFVDHIQTDSDEPSVVIPIRKRFKNFDSIETRIENKEIREGLSILGLQYRYYLTTNRR